jgi:hypothetical protein
MLKEGLAKFNYDLREGSLVAVAAKIYGCEVSDLLSWAEKDDGSVVIIAPTGQKFTYSANEIMKKILEPTGLACGGTGSVIRTEADMVTETPEPGADRVAKTKKVVTVGPDADVGDVTKDEEVVTDALDPGAGHVTKADDEMVTPLATAAAAPVPKAPAKRKSTRRRKASSTREKVDPEK